jgi:hypothetical protein
MHICTLILRTMLLLETFFVFAVLYSQLAKSRGGKTPPNLPLANKRKDHSHTTPTLVSRTQYTCFRRAACTHAEPMAYYIFYISRRKRPHEEKFKSC